MIRRPRRSTLFPYTTLSRSNQAEQSRRVQGAEVERNTEELPPPVQRKPYGEQRGLIEGDLEQEREEVKRPVSLRGARSEEHTSELQSPCNLVCRLLLEKKKN